MISATSEGCSWKMQDSQREDMAQGAEGASSPLHCWTTSAPDTQCWRESSVGKAGSSS